MSLARVALVALVPALTALVTACEDELPEVDCAPPVPGYAVVHAFSISCTTCHASTLRGASRFGAPAGVNFDSHAAAVPHAAHAARRVYAGEMPPTGQLADADELALYRWALCGTPP